MQTKRIKISDENIILLEKIKKDENLSNEELWEKLIISYCYNKVNKKNRNTELSSILEYLKLLVKANKDLPTNEEEMNRIVNASSRFETLIEDKVYKNGEKKL